MFNQQFEQIRSRYKFLVLEGKSKTGKTYFTKWMLGNPSRVFETNCASCPEPELRDFKALYHQVILFDEAAPEMVIRQKKTFSRPAVLCRDGLLDYELPQLQSASERHPPRDMLQRMERISRQYEIAS